MKSWLISCILITEWLLPTSGEDCPDLPPVNNSILVGSCMEGKVLGTYICIHGYHLVGKKELIYNNISLEWDSPAPICHLGHCPIPMLVNGQMKPLNLEPVSEGEVVTFECDTDYILKGSNWSQCQKNHTWMPPLPICRTGQCTPPTKPKHGHFKARDFNSGANVTFSCDEGYQLIGAQSLQCMNGEWNHEFPICEKIEVKKKESCIFQENNRCETVKRWIQYQKASGQTLEELKYSLTVKKLQLEKIKFS